MITIADRTVEMAHHLKFTHPDGSSKEWIGSVNTGGVIRTWWGKSGQVNQTAAKPQSTPSDYGRLLQEKLHKGYKQIDLYTDKDGWESQRIAKNVGNPLSPETLKANKTPKTPKPPKLTSIFDSAPKPKEALDWDF